MSTHNICFCGEIRKISVFFFVEKSTYLELYNIGYSQYVEEACASQIFLKVNKLEITFRAKCIDPAKLIDNRMIILVIFYQ